MAMASTIQYFAECLILRNGLFFKKTPIFLLPFPLNFNLTGTMSVSIELSYSQNWIRHKSLSFSHSLYVASLHPALSVALLSHAVSDPINLSGSQNLFISH